MTGFAASNLAHHLGHTSAANNRYKNTGCIHSILCLQLPWALKYISHIFVFLLSLKMMKFGAVTFWITSYAEYRDVAL